MNNEPVAIRYDFDGYGYQYMDSGSGSDWQTRVDGELLYTHPLKELTDEEILKVWRENERVYPMDRSRLLDRTRACIRKALAK